jgi:catechol 2,3-dioxygenase-like lactoylglutathione lyase family enzyme
MAMAAETYRSGRGGESHPPRTSGLALDHVQVAAPPGCEADARAFYGDLLGLCELRKPDALRARGGAWFALDGGAQLHVGVVADDGFAPAAKAHPALRCAGGEPALRALAAQLSHAGSPVTWDDALPGVVARFFTADPWGNRIELLA